MIQTILTLLSLTILANIVLGLMVLLRTYKRPYGWYFALSLTGIALWAIGDMVMLFARQPGLVHFGAEIFYIAPTVIPVAILLFSMGYPDNQRLNWRPLIVPTSVIAMWAVLFILDFKLFISDILITHTQNVPVLRMPGFAIYSLHFVVFFIATYLVQFQKYRRSAGVAKTQINFTLVGTVVASMLALVPNVSLPVIYNDVHYIWLGPVLTLIFVIDVSYAIIRHRLFDIRSVVARAMGYILSLFVLASVYGLVVFAIAKYIFNLNIGMWPQVFISAATGIAALAFTRLKSFFDRMTNKLFFRDAYSPQELFAELNKVLVSSIDLAYLLKHTTDLLASNLKVEYCVVGLKHDEGDGYRLIGTQSFRYPAADVAHLRKLTPLYPETVIITESLEAPYEDLKEILERNNVHALVRLAHESQQSEGLGYIILGIKKSGNSYNSQDIQVLDTVANELIIAIQNALRFEEIQKFNVTLQRRIEEATAQLRRTNAKLQALDETKDDFISMASHQLRTPLTSVKGYLSMVLEGDAGKLAPLQRKMLDQAFVSSQRMVFLIADLLNVSRLKTGKFIIEATRVNLAKIVSDEVSQLKETAKTRSLTLIYDKPDNFPILMIDETKIRQVIMNFIDNAIYYTTSGGKITVQLIDKPTTIEFKVIDTGIGVPKREQPHLFTKFYRAGNARQARPDGTGLGLFMAKKVIIAQGGAVIFESHEGKGSTFGFIFAKDKLLAK